jgi:hypothetical protein
MTQTIKIKLYADERDFIIDVIKYALLDELLSKLKNAKPDRDNMVTIALDSYDLEQLIGNLSLEANHNKKRLIQEIACDLADKLESYEFTLKQ